MFTGIINHIGTVKNIHKSGDWIFTIGVKNFTRNLAIGASVACSGVCLTVIGKDANSFRIQASRETLSRTTLGSWRKGTKTNLERALKAGDELGGHFVSGHVDGLARLIQKKAAEESMHMTFSTPAKLSRFLAEKGSVTLDGVSLTINKVAQSRFSVNIIPHTLSQTTLGERETGDAVHLEIDIIARYLGRLNQP